MAAVSTIAIIAGGAALGAAAGYLGGEAIKSVANEQAKATEREADKVRDSYEAAQEILELSSDEAVSD